jgi:hypothetical protein
LWRLKAVTIRLVLESFKSLVLGSSFWDFLWRLAFILQNQSHCDGHKCDRLWRFCDSLTAVTMKTNKESFKSPSLSGFLWRLIAVTMRLVFELAFFETFCDFFLFFVTFFYFLWQSAFILQKPSHCDGHKCNHLWRFCDSHKAVTMKTVIENFKSPSLAGFFVTICDVKVLFHGPPKKKI